MNSDTHTTERLNLAKALVQKGNFKGAETQINTLLDDEPDCVEGLYILAVCQRKQHASEQALSTLALLHSIDPEHSHGFQEIGYNYLALNNQPAAIKALEQATAVNPALHGAWNTLSKIEGYQNANHAKLQFSWLNSMPKELLSVSSFIHQNKLHKAETLCRQFLKRQPHHPEAMRLLAELGSKFQILDDAEYVLEKCLEFKPDYLRARVDYVEVLHRRQKFHKALEQAQILFDIDPNNLGFQVSLGNAQQATGDYDSASSTYQQVLEKTPNNHTVHLALGHTLKTAGQTQHAIRAYRTAYEAKADYGDAYWSLANLKTYAFSDNEIANMRAHEQDDSISALDRIQMCFALGKAYEDTQDYAQSYHYYQRGNELKASESRFDYTRLQAELNHQKAHFDHAFFATRAALGCQSSAPIFIVGLPRAGSTLLEQILASHSQVDGTMELANIIGMAHRFNGRSSARDEPKYPSILSELSEEHLTMLGDNYIKDTQAHRQGAAFFIDKMPNNFRHIALIHLILPNAKIIDARRDPMACCFSGYKQLFAEGQEFSYSQTDIGNYYREYVDVMQHWDEVLPGTILRVQHEDLLDDLEGQVRRMLDYCNLPFEQNCVDFHKTKRAVRTPSSEQVRQPIFKTAKEQWRNYEAYLDPLKAALANT